MKCPWKPKWFNKRLRLYSFTDVVYIDKQVVREKVYVGYFNIFSYKFRFKLFVEKVR